MRKTSCWLLAIFLVLPSFASSQVRKDDPRVKEALHLLELWLDAQVAYNELPGLSIAVVHDQDILWSGGFGYAHPDRKIPATQKTIYNICSISKLFTGIAPVAGYSSTVEDLAKFASWQFRLREKGGTEILNVNTLISTKSFSCGSVYVAR